MAIIEIKQCEYSDFIGSKFYKETRWRVTFMNHILAIFTQEDSANKFVNSHLCESLVEHFYSQNKDLEDNFIDINYEECTNREGTD